MWAFSIKSFFVPELPDGLQTRLCERHLVEESSPVSPVSPKAWFEGDFLTLAEFNEEDGVTLLQWFSIAKDLELTAFALQKLAGVSLPSPPFSCHQLCGGVSPLGGQPDLALLCLCLLIEIWVLLIKGSSWLGWEGVGVQRGHEVPSSVLDV